jgi:hypothetical protein
LAALGVAPPLAGTQLRAEIAITSWHRERWMSLSGGSPVAAMSHPETWRRIWLGGRPQMIETAPVHPALAPG